ncbi:tape measure protein [Aerococcus urinaeequi]|uniref:tape measure protein n=1 Tax=Aerococcus urinaeequi TaxID=51665 RepID=UPI003EC80F52
MAKNLEAVLRLRDEFTKSLERVDSQLQKTTKSMDKMKSVIDRQKNMFDSLASAAQSSISRMNSVVRSSFNAMTNTVKTSIERILQTVGNFGNRIKSVFNLGPLLNIVSSTFNKIATTIKGKFSDITSSLKGFGSKIASALKLDVAFRGITSAFNSLKSKATSTFSAISNTISNAFKGKKIKALADMESQLTKLSKKKANIEINVKSAEDAQRRLGNVDKALNKLNSKKASLEIKANASGLEKSSKRLEELNSKITKLNGTKARLEADASRLEGARKALSQVQQDIHKLNREKILLQLDPSGIRGALSKAGSMISSFSQSVSNKFGNIGRNIGLSFSQLKSTVGNFGNDMRNAFSNVSNGANTAHNSVLELASAFGVLKLAGAAVGLIGKNLDAAIGRFDILQRFPKIMDMWGYSSDVVSKAQTKMVDGIEGLPTTLQDITGNVQAMTSITGDLDKATDVSLALNNAFLASGASTADASRGLQQFSQMLSVGKVDMMAWRTLQETMPGALSQTAKAFGFAGSSATTDFYDALDNGEISMTEFQDKLIELNGATDGFADQAKVASAGIKTSFQNLANTMSKGLANSITAIDEWAKSNSFGTIAENIDNMKGIINEAFSSINESIPKFLDKLLPYLQIMQQAFEKVKEPIKTAINSIRKSLDAISGDKFGSKGSLNSFQGFVDGLVEGIEKLADFANKHSDTIAKVIDMFGKLVGAFIGFNLGKAVVGMPFKILGTLFSPFASFLTTGWGIAKAVGKLGLGIGGSIATLFGGGKGANKLGKSVLPTVPTISAKDSGLNFLNSLSKTASQFAKGAKNIALIYGVIKLIEELAEAMKQVNDKVPADLSSLAPKLGNMAIALTGMGAFVGVAGAIAKNNFGNAVKGLVVIAGLSGNIMLAAEAMQQVSDKVPDNIATFSSKLANMAIAISGMGVLVAVAGQLATLNPMGAIAGLVVVALISGELMLAAEAMKQVNDKVPDNIGSFASKVANIAIGIGGMFALVQIVGTLAALNPIGTIAGLATVALIAGELILVAEAMKQVNEKVPDDVGNFKNKINNMASAINAFNEADFGGMVEIVQNALAGLNFAVITGAIDKMIDLANKLNQLNEIEVSADVSTKINQIESAISALDMSSLTDVIASLTTTIDLTVLNTAIDQLIKISSKLAELNAVEVNAETAKSKIAGIMNVLSALDGATLVELIGAALEASQLEKAVSSINSMVSMASPINTLASSEINAETATANITKIQSVVDTLKQSILSGIFTDIMPEGDLNDALASIQVMQELATPINSIAGVEINSELANSNIEKIKSVYSQLRTGKLSEIFTDLLTADELAQSLESIKAMQNLVSPINTIAETKINSEIAIENIGKVKDVFNKLRTGFLSEVFTDLLTADKLTEALESINVMSSLVDPINTISEYSVNSELAIAVIDKIKDVIGALSDNVLTAWLENPITTDKIEEVRSAIQGIQGLITPVNGLANSTVNSEAAVTVIGNIKSVITAMNGIVVEMGDNISGQLETVKTAISKLQEVGNAVNTFSQGVFDFAGALNQINQIKNIITQLNALPASTGVEGLQGLISTFNQLTTAINSFSTQSAVSIDSLISAFSRLGSSSNMMASITSQSVTRMMVSFQSGMTSIRAIVTSGMSAISSNAVSGMARFNSAISSGISRAASTARSGSSQISSAFNGLNGQLHSAGIFAMAGLTSGISSGASRAIAAARSVANSVSNTIRTALKIHSPSRVMVSIGEYITQGLAKGIMASSKLVDKASGRLADMATPQVEIAGINANLPTEMAGATRVINEILNPADMSEVSSYDNGISMDQSDIDDMHAVLDRKVIIENKQVVPQVTVVVNDNEGGTDPEAIARQVEEILVKAMDEDMS